jgi:hypothetical protein
MLFCVCCLPLVRSYLVCVSHRILHAEDTSANAHLGQAGTTLLWVAFRLPLPQEWTPLEAIRIRISNWAICLPEAHSGLLHDSSAKFRSAFPAGELPCQTACIPSNFEQPGACIKLVRSALSSVDWSSSLVPGSMAFIFFCPFFSPAPLCGIS